MAKAPSLKDDLALVLEHFPLPWSGGNPNYPGWLMTARAGENLGPGDLAHVADARGWGYLLSQRGLSGEQAAAVQDAALRVMAAGVNALADPGTAPNEATLAEAEARGRDTVLDALRSEDGQWILGRPNFWCGPYAHLRRATGETIEARAEDEQAHVLAWLLELLVTRGDEWRDAVAEDLDERRRGLLPCKEPGAEA